MWLSEHICEPATDKSVCTARDEIVGVLGTDHLHPVDRVRVSSCRKRCLEYWKVFRSCVPEQYLTRVGTTEDQSRVVWRECD